MTIKKITNLLTGSNMRAGLKADFAEELLRKATETSEYKNISVKEAFTENMKHYVECARHDAERKKGNWVYAFNEYSRGIPFDMPYGNDEIFQAYALNADSYWHSLGRGLETVARKVNLI